MDLQPCPTCARHVAAVELRCPFCATELVRHASRVPVRGRWSRAAVFAGAALAAACGGKARGSEEPHEQHHGGGGCVDPDPAEIERLEKQREQATSEQEKQAIEAELERARMPVCMPYGAPPARRRSV